MRLAANPALPVKEVALPATTLSNGAEKAWAGAVWAAAAWACNGESLMRVIMSFALLLLAAACTNSPSHGQGSDFCQGSSAVCHNTHKGGGHGGQHGLRMARFTPSVS